MSQKPPPPERTITLYECEVCGELGHSEEGKLEDTTLVCCENNHDFCEEHLNEADPADLENIVEEAFIDGNLLPPEAKKINLLITIGEFVSEGSKELVRNYIFDYWPREIPEEICPICTLNHIQDSLLIRKLLDMVQASRGQIEEIIRLECGTLEEAQEHYSTDPAQDIR
jgi:hypothetical protein